MLLGLIPGGYGKWDGLFGVWILILVVCFSLFVWRIYSPSVSTLERTPAFVLCILGFGGILGGVLVTVYAVARSVSKWIFSQLVSNDGSTQIPLGGSHKSGKSHHR